MTRLLTALVLLGLLGAAGCGGGSTYPTGPLDEEMKQKIKEEDKQIDDEERSGSGSASPVKKKK